MAKTFDLMFKELQEFVEQHKRMPRPQCRSDKDEMLLGLWVFRTLQHCTVEEENKIRLLAKGLPGPCPKPYTDRVKDLNKFVSEHDRLPDRSSGETERSLSDFVKKNLGKPEIAKICARCKRGV